MKLILKWITLNLPQIILICGFCLLSIGCFFINLPAGFIASGISLIALAVVANQSE
ncbi:hypothetical protein [Companilactobacillus farciminis]|uniref:hypothetical protein n=1 Tax=Companilactobacillus farciminis TaxID=1612 RepID=UPI00241E5109|nr:hypothetical protein [Companilactobacillus farciminis]